MDFEPAIRLRILAFVGFFFLFALIWGAFDLFGYFAHGDRPSTSEVEWMIGVYVVAWFSAEIWERFKRNRKHLDELESRLATIEKQNQK